MLPRLLQLDPLFSPRLFTISAVCRRLLSYFASLSLYLLKIGLARYRLGTIESRCPCKTGSFWSTTKLPCLLVNSIHTYCYQFKLAISSHWPLTCCFCHLTQEESTELTIIRREFTSKDPTLILESYQGQRLKTPRRIRKTLHSFIMPKSLNLCIAITSDFLRRQSMFTPSESAVKLVSIRDVDILRQIRETKSHATVGSQRRVLLGFDPNNIRELTERCELDNKFQSNCMWNRAYQHNAQNSYKLTWWSQRRRPNWCTFSTADK